MSARAAHGVAGDMGKRPNTGRVCCAASCKVCAHPSAQCSKRPGGRNDCCPSAIQMANRSCEAHGAPCVLSGPPDGPDAARPSNHYQRWAEKLGSL